MEKHPQLTVPAGSLGDEIQLDKPGASARGSPVCLLWDEASWQKLQVEKRCDLRGPQFFELLEESHERKDNERIFVE